MTKFNALATLTALTALAATALAGCATTTHDTVKSSLGTPQPASALLAVIDQPGPVELETVNSADWAVPLSGLLNLDHPKAKAAGLEERDEPIQVFFHAIRHPTQGLWIVDTGIETAQRDNPDEALFSGFVGKVMHAERFSIHAPLGVWLKAQPAPLTGVLLTHMHMDHVSGMRDVPTSARIVSGTAEAHAHSFQNMFVQALTNEAFEGKGAVEELAFQPDADGRFAGVLDLFGDGSVWALWVPGHTPGSVAYVVRTTTGPVLLTGDACHTRWGWDNGVEPGSYTADQALNADHLARLKKLAAEHPQMRVQPGHQR
jgi:N-acyl homoserine lactone hydrolase